MCNLVPGCYQIKIFENIFTEYARQRVCTFIITRGRETTSYNCGGIMTNLLHATCDIKA